MQNNITNKPGLKMGNDYLDKVENYIFNYYKENSPAVNVYHSLEHIKSVVKLVEEIGDNSKLSKDELEVLKIAAWFHDIGHVKVWEKHEELSAEIAKDFLKSIDFPAEKIKKVKKCILATDLKSHPENILEEVIRDADIAHTGSDEYGDKSDLLKIEMEKRGMGEFTDLEWMKENINFLTKVKFFTKYAKEKFEKEKIENLIKLQKKYDKKLEKKNKKLADSEKLEIEKEKLAKKSIESRKSDRGIETMFRNVIRTHVSFSSMADSKANIMISVNTLLLGAIFTILARKLDVNPNLIIPTGFLTVVCLVTLILAIKVTRPVISSGFFTEEDIKDKKANLLFFGNFYKMGLKDFTWGMNEMMEDKDFLYGSMIKDFYYLGQVLGRKYKLLRLCYNIFMYGIIAAAILFTLFIWLYPNPMILDNLID